MLFSTPLLFIFLYILKKKKDKNKKNDCGYVDKKRVLILCFAYPPFQGFYPLSFWYLQLDFKWDSSFFHKFLKDGKGECVHKNEANSSVDFESINGVLRCGNPPFVWTDRQVVDCVLLLAHVIMAFSTGLSTHIVHKYWWVKKKELLLWGTNQ